MMSGTLSVSISISLISPSRTSSHFWFIRFSLLPYPHTHTISLTRNLCQTHNTHIHISVPMLDDFRMLSLNDTLIDADTHLQQTHIRTKPHIDLDHMGNYLFFSVF